MHVSDAIIEGHTEPAYESGMMVLQRTDMLTRMGCRQIMGVGALTAIRVVAAVLRDNTPSWMRTAEAECKPGERQGEGSEPANRACHRLAPVQTVG